MIYPILTATALTIGAMIHDRRTGGTADNVTSAALTVAVVIAVGAVVYGLAAWRAVAP